MTSLQPYGAERNTSINALTPFARFYPINPDKSPACRNLAAESTSDPLQIRQWERRGHAGLAARIAPSSRMFVLDLESPYKHRGTAGPDGMMSLCWRLADHDIELPDAPTVRTGSGGYHLYLMAPDAAALRSSVSLWPGVDVLSGGSNVILPGSRTLAGTYEALRGFHECAIPEAPASIIDMIAREQNALKRSRHDAEAILATMPIGEDAFVPKQKWFLLWRNKVFRTMWHRKKLFGDTSKSAYEYHLAKACFVVGLNAAQCVTVLRCWWRLYGMNNRMRKFQRGIILAAWREVAPYVQEWMQIQDTNSRITTCRGRVLSAASRGVLALRVDHPEWSVRQIADAAGITYDHAAKIIRRHASE